MKKLELSKLKIDDGTQPRCDIDESLVTDYAEEMKGGATFPPVVVFHDGAAYWLADGFHRTHAARRADIKSIQADIQDGTKRDAILYSVGANAAHGLRRTNADKHKAVMTLLQDEEWSKWSDREIARQCAVGHPMVGRLRKFILEQDTSMASERTFKHHKTGNTSTMNTENIGKTKQAAPDRARQIKYLADQGYRADQIADELQIGRRQIWAICKDYDIELPDKKMGKTRRIEVHRVVEETVNGLSGYAIGLQTINGELKDVSPDDAQAWADSIGESIKPINRLRKKLQEIANA